MGCCRDSLFEPDDSPPTTTIVLNPDTFVSSDAQTPYREFCPIPFPESRSSLDSAIHQTNGRAVQLFPVLTGTISVAWKNPLKPGMEERKSLGFVNSIHS